MFLSPHHKLPQMHSSYRMAFHLLRVPTIQLHNCIMYVCEREGAGGEGEREGRREGGEGGREGEREGGKERRYVERERGRKANE